MKHGMRAKVRWIVLAMTGVLVALPGCSNPPPETGNLDAKKIQYERERDEKKIQLQPEASQSGTTEPGATQPEATPAK